jgi:hypothetical protein
MSMTAPTPHKTRAVSENALSPLIIPRAFSASEEATLQKSAKQMALHAIHIELYVTTSGHPKWGELPKSSSTPTTDVTLQAPSSPHKLTLSMNNPPKKKQNLGNYVPTSLFRLLKIVLIAQECICKGIMPGLLNNPHSKYLIFLACGGFYQPQTSTA